MANSKYSMVERVNELSLLITVQGHDPTLQPYLLAGHLDVVPVVEQFWSVPPFSGQIKDNYIYGRGAVDIKSLVMAILEALEHLLSSGFQPQRSFFVAFGHDEEVLGSDGAGEIAKLLANRGIKALAFVLDEGLAIIKQAVPGVSKPAAMVGVTEKGFVNVKLEVQLENAGHSSMPPRETAITILASELSR